MSLTQKQIDDLKRAEDASTCEHCGRCVVLGPPYCYESLWLVYQTLQRDYAGLKKENEWLRRFQSKKDKKIHELTEKISKLKKIEE